MIKHRILFGTLMILAIVGLLFADAWTGRPGLIVTPICAGLALWGFVEFCRLLAAQGHKPFTRLGSVALLALFAWNVWLIWYAGPFVPTGAPDGLPQLPLTWWTATVGGLFLAGAFFYFERASLSDIAVTVLGLAVVAAPLLLMLALRRMGMGALVMVLMATKLNDVAAYLVGSRIGKHKIVPKLSPKKSLEGFIAGLVLSLVVAVVYGLLATRYGWRPSPALWQSVVLGLVIGVTGPVGDLFESLIKRQSNIKDSGDIVPTFGGILDLVDSVLLTVPVALVVFGPIA